MKVILFTTLLLFSVNRFAFNWTKVAEDDRGDIYYVDVDSIKKHNGLVYYWRLEDYLVPLSSGTNSSIDKFKIDCGEEKVIWLNTTSYS